MELLKAVVLGLWARYLEKKQSKPPCSLTFQFLIGHFKHRKAIAF